MSLPGALSSKDSCGEVPLTFHSISAAAIDRFSEFVTESGELLTLDWATQKFKTSHGMQCSSPFLGDDNSTTLTSTVLATLSASDTGALETELQSIYGELGRIGGLIRTAWSTLELLTSGVETASVNRTLLAEVRRNSLEGLLTQRSSLLSRGVMQIEDRMAPLLEALLDNVAGGVEISRARLSSTSLSSSTIATHLDSRAALITTFRQSLLHPGAACIPAANSGASAASTLPVSSTLPRVPIRRQPNGQSSARADVTATTPRVPSTSSTGVPSTTSPTALLVRDADVLLRKSLEALYVPLMDNQRNATALEWRNTEVALREATELMTATGLWCALNLHAQAYSILADHQARHLLHCDTISPHDPACPLPLPLHAVINPPVDMTTGYSHLTRGAPRVCNPEVLDLTTGGMPPSRPGLWTPCPCLETVRQVANALWVGATRGMPTCLWGTIRLMANAAPTPDGGRRFENEWMRGVSVGGPLAECGAWMQGMPAVEVGSGAEATAVVNISTGLAVGLTQYALSPASILPTRLYAINSTLIPSGSPLPSFRALSGALSLLPYTSPAPLPNPPPAADPFLTRPAPRPLNVTTARPRNKGPPSNRIGMPCSMTTCGEDEWCNPETQMVEAVGDGFWSKAGTCARHACTSPGPEFIFIDSGGGEDACLVACYYPGFYVRESPQLSCEDCPAGMYCPARSPTPHRCRTAPINVGALYTETAWTTPDCPWVCAWADWYRVADPTSGAPTCTPAPHGTYSPIVSNLLYPCTHRLGPGPLAEHTSTGSGQDACGEAVAFRAVVPLATEIEPSGGDENITRVVETYRRGLWWGEVDSTDAEAVERTAVEENGSVMQTRKQGPLPQDLCHTLTGRLNVDGDLDSMTAEGWLSLEADIPPAGNSRLLGVHPQWALSMQWTRDDLAGAAQARFILHYRLANGTSTSAADGQVVLASGVALPVGAWTHIALAVDLPMNLPASSNTTATVAFFLNGTRVSLQPLVMPARQPAPTLGLNRPPAMPFLYIGGRNSRGGGSVVGGHDFDAWGRGKRSGTALRVCPSPCFFLPFADPSLPIHLPCITVDPRTSSSSHIPQLSDPWLPHAPLGFLAHISLSELDDRQARGRHADGQTRAGHPSVGRGRYGSAATARGWSNVFRDGTTAAPPPTFGTVGTIWPACPGGSVTEVAAPIDLAGFPEEENATGLACTCDTGMGRYVTIHADVSWGDPNQIALDQVPALRPPPFAPLIHIPGARRKVQGDHLHPDRVHGGRISARPDPAPMRTAKLVQPAGVPAPQTCTCANLAHRSVLAKLDQSTCPSRYGSLSGQLRVTLDLGAVMPVAAVRLYNPVGSSALLDTGARSVSVYIGTQGASDGSYTIPAAIQDDLVGTVSVARSTLTVAATNATVPSAQTNPGYRHYACLPCPGDRFGESMTPRAGAGDCRCTAGLVGCAHEIRATQIQFALPWPYPTPSGQPLATALLQAATSPATHACRPVAAPPQPLVAVLNRTAATNTTTTDGYLDTDVAYSSCGVVDPGEVGGAVGASLRQQQRAAVVVGRAEWPGRPMGVEINWDLAITRVTTAGADPRLYPDFELTGNESLTFPLPLPGKSLFLRAITTVSSQWSSESTSTGRPETVFLTPEATELVDLPPPGTLHHNLGSIHHDRLVASTPVYLTSVVARALCPGVAADSVVRYAIDGSVPAGVGEGMEWPLQGAGAVEIRANCTLTVVHFRPDFLAAPAASTGLTVLQTPACAPIQIGYRLPALTTTTFNGTRLPRSDLLWRHNRPALPRGTAVVLAPAQSGAVVEYALWIGANLTTLSCPSAPPALSALLSSRPLFNTTITSAPALCILAATPAGLGDPEGWAWKEVPSDGGVALEETTKPADGSPSGALVAVRCRSGPGAVWSTPVLHLFELLDEHSSTPIVVHMPITNATATATTTTPGASNSATSTPTAGGRLAAALRKALHTRRQLAMTKPMSASSSPAGTAAAAAAGGVDEALVMITHIALARATAEHPVLLLFTTRPEDHPLALPIPVAAPAASSNASSGVAGSDFAPSCLETDPTLCTSECPCLYQGPFRVSAGSIVRAVALDGNHLASPQAEVVYRTAALDPAAAAVSDLIAALWPGSALPVVVLLLGLGAVVAIVVALVVALWAHHTAGVRLVADMKLGYWPNWIRHLTTDQETAVELDPASTATLCSTRALQAFLGAGSRSPPGLVARIMGWLRRSRHGGSAKLPTHVHLCRRCALDLRRKIVRNRCTHPRNPLVTGYAGAALPADAAPSMTLLLPTMPLSAMSPSPSSPPGTAAHAGVPSTINTEVPTATSTGVPSAISTGVPTAISTGAPSPKKRAPPPPPVQCRPHPALLRDDPTQSELDELQVASSASKPPPPLPPPPEEDEADDDGAADGCADEEERVLAQTCQLLRQQLGAKLGDWREERGGSGENTTASTATTSTRTTGADIPSTDSPCSITPAGV
ncbi:hypothetical protein PAPYR_8451 [Paratrimastix pyriformis]|uniref:Uncharacterized protein n=1 Tax=Paratrimastix pyriformis TaxID=342808 RepID=A0ABQ8UD11_9EUKA|nr:hypothetical protein PAPYR_8451 [Paratrimastix pyriformis]